MKMAETKYDNSETGCCARFDPASWDDGEITWDEAPFVRERVRSFLNIPLNFGSAITRANDAIEAASAYTEDPICLTHHTSPWGSDLYLTVDRDVPGAKMDTLSGTYITKVFEGPYSHAGKWEKQVRAIAHERGLEAGDVYFYYTTCPKCMKHFGKNYVVLFADVTETH